MRETRPSNEGFAEAPPRSRTTAPGRTDVFRLWVAGSELTPGQIAITGGNIQIHV
jgi:hypothetical protein